MRFEIPQFLEIEDKLFGPFSFKQAIYLVGGAAIIYLLFKFLPNYLAFILSIPPGALALALVFYKPNNRPFIKMVGSFLNFSISKKFYLWQHPQKRYEEEISEKAKSPLPEEKEEDRIVRKPALKDIARGLDIVNKIPKKP